jgi:hypothetical protein
LYLCGLGQLSTVAANACFLIGRSFKRLRKKSLLGRSRPLSG